MGQVLSEDNTAACGSAGAETGSQPGTIPESTASNPPGLVTAVAFLRHFIYWMGLGFANGKQWSQTGGKQFTCMTAEASKV